MSGTSTLARASVRHRMPTFAATFLAIWLSSLVVGSFATLVEAAAGDVSAADRETLVTMGAVIGGWGGLIALFSLVSTFGVSVRRRRTEVGLLRTVGATPRQVRRLLRRETLLVAVVAAVAGAVPAWAGGRALLDLLRDAGMVAGTVSPGLGVASLGATVVAVVVVSLVAAGLAARRVTGGPARLALADEAAATPRRRARLWRPVLAALLIGYAVAGGVVTVAVMADRDDPYAAMQTSGSASILAGVGLALLAPHALRLLAARLRRVEAASAWLAAWTAYRRPGLVSGVVGPVVVFVAATTGTLMLVGIDGRTLVLPPGMSATDAETITTLNNVVVGMIALFAAIMVVNSLLAVVGDRATELGRLRLVGATDRQVRRTVLAESLLVGVVGAVLGLLGSLATIVPFAIAREEGLVPDGQLWLPVAVALAAIALSAGAGRIAVRRALRVGTPTAVVRAA